MIQYYLNALIDILTYALKPKYNVVPEPPMETTTNYSYGSHPQQILDFYKGDGTTNKLFIFLHGGSWWALNRQKDHYYTAFIQYFVQNNPDISVVNMDYRLLLEINDGSINVFPDQIDDVQTVMQIFHDAGYEITLGGNSAGGHLAMWYYWNEIEPKPSNVVSIVAPYYGNAPYGSGIYFDVEKTWVKQQMVSQQIRTDLGLDTFAEVSEYASPRTWIKPELDDLLVIYGTTDTTMLPSQITTYMMADYPHIRYVDYNGGHQGWHSSTMKPITSTEIRNFMLKERTSQSQHGAGRYLVQPIPEENANNKYGHINSPFELNAKGSIDGNTFQSFKGEVIQGLISDYSLKKISYDFSSFTRAFNIITPETENGYTFMIIKNDAQRYLLTHKGFSVSKYTIPKGNTNQDVEFLTLRISNSEVLFYANTPEDWKYKIYYNRAGAGGLDSSNRLFTDIPSLYIFNSANGTVDYHFRIQGEDENGNLTEWSTDHVDGTDAFYVPMYGQETNEYMPELEKVYLTSNLFSVVFYPTFNQGLGMIGVQYNNDQEILRSTDFDRVYANTSDEVKPDVDAVLEMHRFNPQSERYQNLLYQLGTEDLDARSQLEWDAINGVEIPEVEIREVTLTRTSKTTYLVESTHASENLKFKRLSDGLIQDVADATLPYTFTHTEGEVWEVSRDDGLTWVKSYGIRLQDGAYLEPENISDLSDFTDAKLYLNIANITVGANSFDAIVRRVADTARTANISLRKGLHWIRFALRNAHQTEGPTGTQYAQITNAFDEIEYIHVSQNDNMKLDIGISTSIVENSEYLKGFSPNTKTTFLSPQEGYLDIYRIEWKGDVFKLSEGTGTQTISENGVKLMFLNNPLWVQV